ncbi:cupin domain-containing protein [Litoribacter populi]|uniref:cupin domain-containing protein n=1 Tax=Litoribacter populi TaxID=2598460 RepID=UPI00117C22CC|nr:hypothetical protein [Litoribacter populi]
MNPCVKLTHPVSGDSVEFVSTTKENDGFFSIMHVLLNPTSNIPYQVHRKTVHVFTSLKGGLCIRLKGGELELLPEGKSFTVFPNTPYAVLNPGVGPIKYEHKVNPGRRGYEDAINIAFGMLRVGHRMSMVEKSFLDYISDTYPCTLQEKMLQPLRRFFAQKALKDGAYKKLMDKYGVKPTV